MFAGSSAGCKEQSNLGCGIAWGGFAVICIALLLAQLLSSPPTFSEFSDGGVPEFVK